MSLGPGVRFGPYKVISALGAGGMGEVYLARDTRLHRDVALKFLPDVFAADPERVARFEREAQVLASLSHPHIAAIHGLEEASGVRALVLEFVDGDTLAERIARGPIPLDEALPLARQIAQALAAAHEHGIIHRDLKPANIKVTPDGVVKVLDFGLAKLAESPEAAVASGFSRKDLTASPTGTSPAMMTGVGMLLGTAAYMSPEQAKGRSADKRSDIWAFGCVLYEMLTGKRAFAGEDVSDTLATVLKMEPDWTALPSETSGPTRTLIEVCLRKDRQQRPADMSVALFVLEHQATLTPHPRYAAAAPTGSRAPLWRRVLPPAVVALATAVAGGAGVWMLTPEPSRPVARFSIVLPDDQEFTNAARRLLAVSPAGDRLAYTANNRLYVRSIDQLEATSIPGTEGIGNAIPRNPFFSPDGQWIGFWQNGQLKKVSLAGGAPVVLCALTPAVLGARWMDDGTIVFGQGDVLGGTGIFRISENGGTPEQIVKVDPGQYAFDPQILPGGRAVLYTLAKTAASPDESDIVVQTLGTGTRQTVVRGGIDGMYLPTGHLIYVLRGSLVAVGFDIGSLKVIGGPVPLVNDVWLAGSSVLAQFSISRDGMLVYVPPPVPVEVSRRTLTWVSRSGQEEPLMAPARPYFYPRLSPDATRVTFDIADENRDIWVWDLARRILTRLTFDPAIDRSPLWSRDGQRIIFSSDRAGVGKLFWQAAEGTGAPEQLTQDGRVQFATSVTPDGGRLVLREGEALGSILDLMTLSFDGDRRVRPLLQTQFRETNGEVSPDGRWLAYLSDASGSFEIYVRPFPDVGAGQWQVSTEGGAEPVWARNGRELFYRASGGALMRVPITAESRPPAGVAVKLFDGKSYVGANDTNANVLRSYDVAPDGQRFLMVKDPGPQAQTTATRRIIFVQNWLEELKRRVPLN